MILKVVKEKKGITLIALVITIIVLLILAGVTIATLTGDNGILTQTTKAKEESEKAEIIEQIQLDIADKQIENLGSIDEDEFYEILGKYGTVSVDETMLTTTKGTYDILISDIYSGEIASSLVTTPIESWEYTISGTDIILNRYNGTDTKIKVPATFNINNIEYNTKIKNTSGANESMDGVFVNNNYIERISFEQNVSLVNPQDGYALFYNCSTLRQVDNFPSGLTTLQYAFSGCSNLIHVPDIPEGITSLSYTFQDCTKLVKAPMISSTVTNINACFYNCINLEGDLIIKANNIENISNGTFSTTKKEISIIVENNSKTFNTLNSMIQYWPNVNFKQEGQILCWGDSLTLGAGGNNISYPSVLFELCNGKKGIVNMGIGGETTTSIATRQGGISLYVEPFTIPAETIATEITLKSENIESLNLAIQGTKGLNICNIDGIDGEISYENSKYYFKRLEEGNEKVLSKEVEVITSGMKYKNADVIVLWTGQNDNPTIENISAIVEKQQKMIDYANTNKYIVIGLLYAGNEVNNAMAEAYGEHFLDVRNALSTDNSNTVSEDYKSDSIHLNADGYTIVAEQVYNKLISLGYISE